MRPVGDLSPNQLEKRRQIVEAARAVLARDGVSGATARAVADASPLTKSAIHYYFADMDQLVDEAMAGHIAGFLDELRGVGDPADDPVERFWAVVERYLGIFERMPGAARLWYGYWLDAVARDRPDPIARLHREVVALLVDLLTVAGGPEPGTRADALLSYLLGTVMRQAVGPVPFERVRREVGALCGLATAPAAAVVPEGGAGVAGATPKSRRGKKGKAARRSS